MTMRRFLSPGPVASGSVSLVLLAALGLGLASCKAKKPEPAPSAAPSEAVESAAVVPASPDDWVKQHFAQDVGGDTAHLLTASAEVDLDGDGTKEVLVYVGGPMMCGTGGCDLVVLKRDGDGFRQVGDLSVVQLPVGVLKSKTNGWRDLAVSVSGGGGPGGIMKVPFDGKAYADNPTVAPAEPVDTIGQELIPAKPLKPLKPLKPVS